MRTSSEDRARISTRKTTSITKFYTQNEIAESLSVSTRTVRRWIENKLLITHRINGVVRISATDLAAFLAAQRAV
jgi:excisionase family DNA binding protein